MPNPPSPRQAPTVADRLRAEITSGRIAMGTRLYDKQLADDMHVSRTPVREALLQLQNEGLIVIKPQSGTFVFDMDADDVRQICATRAILETAAVRLVLAAGGGDAVAWLAPLVGRAAVALEDGDLAACDELDWQFHEGLVAATGNRYLVRAYADIAAPLRALRQRLPQEPARIGRAIDQHRRILDLAAAERVDAAADEVAAHVDNVERLLAAVAAPADGSFAAPRKAG